MNNPPFAAANNPAVFNRPQLKPDHFFVADLYRGPRENHPQKKYVPVAMALSLAAESRWQSPLARARRVADDTMRLRSPGTVRLNRSNVKRKPGARGRTR